MDAQFTVTSPLVFLFSLKTLSGRPFFQGFAYPAPRGCHWILSGFSFRNNLTPVAQRQSPIGQKCVRITLPSPMGPRSLGFPPFFFLFYLLFHKKRLWIIAEIYLRRWLLARRSVAPSFALSLLSTKCSVLEVGLSFTHDFLGCYPSLDCLLHGRLPFF